MFDPPMIAGEWRWHVRGACRACRCEVPLDIPTGMLKETRSRPQKKRRRHVPVRVVHPQLCTRVAQTPDGRVVAERKKSGAGGWEVDFGQVPRRMPPASHDACGTDPRSEKKRPEHVLSGVLHTQLRTGSRCMTVGDAKAKREKKRGGEGGPLYGSKCG